MTPSEARLLIPVCITCIVLILQVDRYLRKKWNKEKRENRFKPEKGMNCRIEGDSVYFKLTTREFDQAIKANDFMTSHKCVCDKCDGAANLDEIVDEISKNMKG